MKFQGYSVIIFFAYTFSYLFKVIIMSTQNANLTRSPLFGWVDYIIIMSVLIKCFLYVEDIVSTDYFRIRIKNDIPSTILNSKRIIIRLSKKKSKKIILHIILYLNFIVIVVSFD